MSGVSPVGIEANRFVLRATGEPFVPRGFNYVRLDLEGKGGHATFSPFVYDRERMGAVLRHMAEGRFNVVRVFINGFRGRRGTLLETADATSLSAAYLDNLTDFLLQAREHGILVIPCFEVFPEAGPYRRFLAAKVENVEGWSRHYLHPGYISAKKAYLKDVIRELRRRNPGALSAVFCWDVMNEVCFPLGIKPFSLSQGKVTPASNVAYDLATDKERLADDMAVYWVDQMAEAVRAEIPDALINANVFTYHAVGRSGPGDFHQDRAAWKNRYPFRPTALLRSSADVIDIHLYCPNAADLEQDLRSIEYEQLTTSLKEHPGKALLVGEFGVFKRRHADLGPAAAWMSDLARRLPGLGFRGWVYWTYDTGSQARLWNAMSERGVIFRALADVPDPAVQKARGN